MWSGDDRTKRRDESGAGGGIEAARGSGLAELLPCRCVLSLPGDAEVFEQRRSVGCGGGDQVYGGVLANGAEGSGGGYWRGARRHGD